ncbi:hypothetical protein [Celeribacter sp.]|uniref:hypothetical protein n=1 Tax=Celeribacter sp. TaxID=1890673 RepID=UPI003A8CDD70
MMRGKPATGIDPMSDEARKILQAACDPKGVKLEGRNAKKAARELYDRGLAFGNKSNTRVFAYPAGRFLIEHEVRSK